MPDQSTSTIDQAVSDVLLDLEQAQAAEDYRAASVARILAGIRLGAIGGYTTTMGAIVGEAAATTLATPAAGDALGAGVLAAVEEGYRLLDAIGAPLPSGHAPTEEGSAP